MKIQHKINVIFSVRCYTFQRCFKFLGDPKNIFGISDKNIITTYLLLEILRLTLRILVYF